jgi:hypothetical protein
MPISRGRLKTLLFVVLISVNAVVALALIDAITLIVLERGWVHPLARSPEDAFRHGSIGTELMLLSVALVLPDLCPEHFLPGGPQAGEWAVQFGFLREADPSANDGLPIGFAVSNYRPQDIA